MRRLEVGNGTVLSRDGNQVCTEINGESRTMTRSDALATGEVLLEIARRPELSGARELIEQGARAIIAVAKSIPPSE